jgi:hypothetical protein
MPLASHLKAKSRIWGKARDRVGVKVLVVSAVAVRALSSLQEVSVVALTILVLEYPDLVLKYPDLVLKEGATEDPSMAASQEEKTHVSIISGSTRSPNTTGTSPSSLEEEPHSSLTVQQNLVWVSLQQQS